MICKQSADCCEQSADCYLLSAARRQRTAARRQTIGVAGRDRRHYVPVRNQCNVAHMTFDLTKEGKHVSSKTTFTFIVSEMIAPSNVRRQTLASRCTGIWRTRLAEGPKTRASSHAPQRAIDTAARSTSCIAYDPEQVLPPQEQGLRYRFPLFARTNE